MPARILHVSDLHVGAQDTPSAEPDPSALGLTALVTRVAPDLVVASGDLTHGGRASEHTRAAVLLQSLGPPVLAVPGNHDIPPLSPARFRRPWAAFEAEWQTTEPVFATAALHVVGLNSVRPGRYQSGSVGEAPLSRAIERLDAAAPGALRVVVLHHQLANAPWRGRKQPLARRDHVLDRLAAAGADLIVGGHTHQAAVTTPREFTAEAGAAVVLATAPGLGRPRPHRRGETRGAMVYTAGEQELEVVTYVRGGNDWELAARRTFPRSG